MSALVSTIEQIIEQLPPYQRLWLGFSGGVDSHVLLHCLRHNPKLRVIHINHGLQAAAEGWVEHCREICNKYRVPCEVVSVVVDTFSGESLEAAARKARYQAFSSYLQPGDILLTAHHSNDQVETFFLQLLRGAGAKGLSSMPIVKKIGDNILHCRPCLQLSREALLAYAETHQLNWIEDPSNNQTHIQRNFLRHHIIPSLAKQWPGLDTVIQRQVQLNQQTQSLLNDLAIIDYKRVMKFDDEKLLCCEGLATLSIPRLHNVLRYWIDRNEYPMPNERRLKAINTIITAKKDGKGEVKWQHVCVRRYKDCLYIFSHEENSEHYHKTTVSWQPQSPYLFKDGRVITCTQPHLFLEDLTIHFRQGGEKFHGDKRIGSHPLKKYFQEWCLPPWKRNNVPLISYKSHIIAVLPFSQAHPRIFEQVGIKPSKISGLLFQLKGLQEF